MQKGHALVCASMFALALAAPARAADDGQDSLISGLAHTFGLAKTEQPIIDYRERGKLVVPPKKVLPPPAEPANGQAAWPTDVETIRDKKLKQQEAAEPSAKDVANRSYQLIHPGDDVKVTASSFSHHSSACRHPDPQTGECPEAARPSMDFNPLHWVGIQKPPPVELGPEPERQTLSDPPKGLRAPAEGVGAKVEN